MQEKKKIRMAEKLLINLKFVFYIIETSYPFSSFSNIRAKLISPFNFSPHFPHFPISIQNLFTFHFQYKIFTSHDCVFIAANFIFAKFITR